MVTKKIRETVNQAFDRVVSSTDKQSPKEAGKRRLGRVPADFDLRSVQCWSENALLEKIRTDEDLLQRLSKPGEISDVESQMMQIQLRTAGYRVDAAITPKLHRLSALLQKILRLSKPLDVYVLANREPNAFCVPSTRGNRLIMGLHSGLLDILNNAELLFVMGHEVGHAILEHSALPTSIPDSSELSVVELLRLKSLSRAREISCDRFGLLACQNVEVASSALFKVHTGLSDRWIQFNENAYAKHFDDLASMAEFVGLDSGKRSHPISPLRVKALIAFANSTSFSSMIKGKPSLASRREIEQKIDVMLSTLAPDLSEIEGVDEQQIIPQFIADGAILMIASDGKVEPGEIAWLKSFGDGYLPVAEIVEGIGEPGFLKMVSKRVSKHADILRHKLPEHKRAGLLNCMFDVAFCSSGLVREEFKELDRLRRMLAISPELAERIFHVAKESSTEGSNENEISEEGEAVISIDESKDETVAAVVADALKFSGLKEAAHAQASVYCQEVSDRREPTEALQALIALVIQEARRGGPLTLTEGKKMVLGAIKAAKSLRNGGRPTSKLLPVEQHVRKYGVVALFKKGELVYWHENGRPNTVTSVSRANRKVKVRPIDENGPEKEVSPHHLAKSPSEGHWPKILT